MSDDTCSICSGLTGVIRQYDPLKLIPLNDVISIELDPNDLYASYQCSPGYQCVLENSLQATGCCERCAGFQSCPLGSISYRTDLELLNGCPNGHYCDDQGNVDKVRLKRRHTSTQNHESSNNLTND